MKSATKKWSCDTIRQVIHNKKLLKYTMFSKFRNAEVLFKRMSSAGTIFNPETIVNEFTKVGDFLLKFKTNINWALGGVVFVINASLYWQNMSVKAHINTAMATIEDNMRKIDKKITENEAVHVQQYVTLKEYLSRAEAASVDRDVREDKLLTFTKGVVAGRLVQSSKDFVKEAEKKQK